MPRIPNYQPLKYFLSRCLSGHGQETERPAKPTTTGFHDLPRRNVLRQLALWAGLAMAAGPWVPIVAQPASPAAVTAAVPAKPLFAYVGSRTTKERNARGEGINVYRIDPKSGAWTHVQLVKDLVNPSFLAFDRQQRFLYVVHGDFSEVSAFQVDQQTGQLTFLNRQSTNGKNPVHLVVDPSNRFLLIANYATGSLTTLPINPDGSLSPITDLAALPGESGPHRIEQKSSHPHHIPYDRTGRFVVVPDKGLDKIFVFRLDSATGKLIPGEPASVASREGAGPRHVEFHPTKPYAYVINELDSTVTTYRYDNAHGRLSPLQTVSTIPATFTANNRASEIAIAPSGRFLYGSNRGHDSLVTFAIDPTSGLLSPLAWAPSQGKKPRFFALAPGGKFLYAANEDSDTIVTFKVNSKNGKLSPTSHVVQTGSPVCIVFSSEASR